MNPDTIGYVWTGEYDLNTPRVDGEIFESATKKLRIRKYPDTCGQGLNWTDQQNLKPLSCFDITMQRGGNILISYMVLD